MEELNKLQDYLDAHGYVYERINKIQQDAVTALKNLGLYNEGMCEKHQIIVYKSEDDRRNGKSWFDVVCNWGSCGYEDGLLEAMWPEEICNSSDDYRIEGWLTAKDIVFKLEHLSWKAYVQGEVGSMLINEYQKLAMRTSNKTLRADGHLINGVLGLSGEAGECADLVKKQYYQDGRNIDEALKEELGDELWYIAEIATAKGWTLEDIARSNIEKLKKRYPDGFSPEKSLNREGEQHD